MRKIILMVVIFVSVLSCTVWAGDKYVKGIIHAHDTNSDGIFPQVMYRPWLTVTGCKYFCQTDHFDCLIGKCDHKSHQKRDSSYVLKYLKQQTAPYFRGIECFTELNGQHILLLGNNWNDIDSLYKANTEQILAYAKNNRLISILAHPHDAYQEEYINDFTAIEFFNTKGYEITKLAKRIKNEKYERAEAIDLKIYCKAIENYCIDHFPGIGSGIKNVPGVTGGCDLHALELELSFGHTFIGVSDTKNLSLPTINSAIENGKTCAVFSNIIGLRAWINSINYPPNRKKIYEVPQIVLKGKITAENCDKLDIYLDGYLKTSLPINVNKGVVEFNKTITTRKGRHVVFLYCKNRLITSPMIFEVTSDGTSTVVPTPTPIASPTLVVVKPRKFTGSLKFYHFPTSATGGGYYYYTVKDETGKVVFKTRLSRHDCVILLKNFVIIAYPMDVKSWNLYCNGYDHSDLKTPYYGQCFIYDEAQRKFVPYFTIAGTTNRYVAGYPEYKHEIKIKQRNLKICLDVLNTYKNLSQRERKLIDGFHDPMHRQVYIFLVTMPAEILSQLYYINSLTEIKDAKCFYYKEYASVNLTTQGTLGIYMILKKESGHWRIIHVNSLNIYLTGDKLSEEILNGLNWSWSNNFDNEYCEFYFRH